MRRLPTLGSETMRQVARVRLRTLDPSSTLKASSGLSASQMSHFSPETLMQLQEIKLLREQTRESIAEARKLLEAAHQAIQASRLSAQTMEERRRRIYEPTGDASGGRKPT
jgi:DNA-binding transcriptional MerR regulator